MAFKSEDLKNNSILIQYQEQIREELHCQVLLKETLQVKKGVISEVVRIEETEDNFGSTIIKIRTANDEEENLSFTVIDNYTYAFIIYSASKTSIHPSLKEILKQSLKQEILEKIEDDTSVDSSIEEDWKLNPYIQRIHSQTGVQAYIVIADLDKIDFEAEVQTAKVRRVCQEIRKGIIDGKTIVGAIDAYNDLLTKFDRQIELVKESEETTRSTKFHKALLNNLELAKVYYKINNQHGIIILQMCIKCFPDEMPDTNTLVYGESVLYRSAILEQAEEELEENLTNLKKRNEELEKQNEQYSKIIEAHEEAEKLNTEEIKRLKDEIDHITEQHSTLTESSNMMNITSLGDEDNAEQINNLAATSLKLYLKLDNLLDNLKLDNEMKTKEVEQLKEELKLTSTEKDDQLNEVKKMNDALEKDIARTRKEADLELATAKQRIVQLLKSKEDVQKDLEKVRNNNSVLTETINTLKRIVSQESDLPEDTKMLSNQIQDLIKQLQDKQEEIAKITAEKDVDVQNLNQKFNELKEQVSQYSDDETLKKKLEEASKKYNLLNNEFESLKLEKESLNRQVTSRESRITTLSNENMNIKEKLRSEESSTAKLKLELVNLQTEQLNLIKEQRTIDTLKLTVQRLENKIEENKGEWENEKTKLQFLIDNPVKNKTIVEAEEDLITKLQDEVKTLNNLVGNQGAEFTREITSLSKEKTDLNEKIKGLEAINLFLNTQNSKLEERIRMNESRDDNNDNKEKIRQLEEDLQNERTRNQNEESRRRRRYSDKDEDENHIEFLDEKIEQVQKLLERNTKSREEVKALTRDWLYDYAKTGKKEMNNLLEKTERLMFNRSKAGSYTNRIKISKALKAFEETISLIDEEVKLRDVRTESTGKLQENASIPLFTGEIYPAHFFEWKDHITNFLKITTYRMADVSLYLKKRLDGHAIDIIKSHFKTTDPTTEDLLNCLQEYFGHTSEIEGQIFASLENLENDSKLNNNSAKVCRKVDELLGKLKILEERVESYKCCQFKLQSTIMKINGISDNLKTGISKQYHVNKNNPEFDLLEYILEELKIDITYRGFNVSQSSKTGMGGTTGKPSRETSSFVANNKPIVKTIIRNIDPSECIICTSYIQTGGEIRDNTHIFSTNQTTDNLLIRPESCPLIRNLRPYDRSQRLVILGICRTCGKEEATSSHRENDCRDLQGAKSFLKCKGYYCNIRASFCDRHMDKNQNSLQTVRNNMDEHNLISMY